MNKYVEAEKRLAELLLPDQDWKIAETGYVYSKVYTGKATWKTHIAPSWTSDWNACGPLMVEHECFPSFRDCHVLVGDYLNTHEVCVSEFPNYEAAVRYAIVMAVIAKKEAEL